MARPPLAIGTYGRITRSEVQGPDGSGSARWIARTRFRDLDGVTRQVKASGSTGAKAEAALKDSLLGRRRSPQGATLNSNSTVTELLQRWMESAVRSEKRTQQTLDYYQRCIDKIIIPGLGGVRLGEASTGRIENFLTAVRTPSGMRDSRTILMQAFALASRLDAIARNPVRDTSSAPSSVTAPRALTGSDIDILRKRVTVWQCRERGDERARSGPERAHDLAEIVDLLIGTGGRIGEVLAVRWQDITGLDDPELPVVVTISGTLIEIRGKGICRQDHPKTKSGLRAVTVPRFAVDALLRQRDRGIPSALGLVFPSRTGAPRWPANVRTAWRQVRGDDYAWVKPHGFRKTVGTLVEREMGLTAASALLGHSGSAVTERHYIERAAIAPDASEVLDRLVRNVSAP